MVGVQDGRERIELLGLLQLGDGFAPYDSSPSGTAHKQSDGGPFRIELKRAPELPLAARPISPLTLLPYLLPLTAHPLPLTCP
jgi:hypothetical protein